VTLSEAQFTYASRRAIDEGLGDRVSIELKDFRELSGSFDKIASIGMYEHVGIDNYPRYFKKLRSLLADDGVLLNHGITRRGKREGGRFRRPSASRRIILKYIFPGAELDHIGHTLEVMETSGLEVHDVEGLRRHYARTCRLWYERLTAEREAAIAHVGAERFRMWQAYLAGVTIGFESGPLRLFQVVATKRGAASRAPLPLTRDDLYTTAS
jgi:cyclopropane-fatty-acyl-phospholipid synthase